MRTAEDAPSSFLHWFLIHLFSCSGLLLAAVGLAACVASAVSLAQQRKAVKSTAAPEPHRSAALNPGSHRASNYGRLPLSFEANQGQADPRVKFLARGSGYTLFLKGSEAEFSLQSRPKAKARRQEGRPQTVTTIEQPVGMRRKARRTVLKATNARRSAQAPTLLHVELLGTNANAPIAGVDKLPGVANYYIGNDRKKWHTGIPTYARVKYQNVYPGIDLVYYGNQQQLEYDFVVAPGADPSRIQMDFRTSGRKKERQAAIPRIDSHGDLVIETSAGEVCLHAPVVYQPAATHKQGAADPRAQAVGRNYVQGRFIAQPGNKIGFKVYSYDHTRPLVIDPAVVFATVVNGGTQSNNVSGMGLDASSNVYVVGDIVPASGYDETVVFGINSQGNSILYTTTLGSTYRVIPGGIAVDPSGNAYIDGVASVGFPTTGGAYQSTCTDQNCTTPFAAKLSPSGSIEYSTYLGPSRGNARAIAIDPSGDAYIAGNVSTTDLPLVNAYQSQFSELFLQKLDPTGSQLLYSSYFGDSTIPTPNPFVTGLALDGSGNIYLLGNGSVPLKNPLEQGVGAMFLAKFTPDGSNLIYSTQLGGSNIQALDTAAGLTVDASGDVYIIGDTLSEDFPVTMNAYRASCLEEAAGDCSLRRAFVLKLDPTGTALLYSTLLGPGWAGGVTIDSSGNAWVTGYGASNYFPTIQSIEQTFQKDSYSASNNPSFLVRLDPNGTPTFSTLFGSNFSSVASTAVAVDGSGNAYIAGASGGADFPFLNPAVGDVRATGGLFIAKISPSASGPVLSLSPRAAGPVELRDLSTSPLTINNITTSSNISIYGGTCGSSLLPGGACTLIWAPANPLTFGSGTITVSSNAPGSPQAFTVYNDFLPITPILFSPGPEFPAQLSGTLSGTQEVTFTNLYYPGPITINSIQIPAPSPTEGSEGVFTQTNDCPATLPAGLSCHINVQYQPVAGADGGMYNTINIDTSQGSYTVYLKAQRSSESLEPSAQSIQFGFQYVGATPLPRVITLTNTDVQAVTVGGVSVSGPFTQINNCTGSLSPHSSCRVSVSFVPTNNGSYTGQLTVNSSGTGSPSTISLAGSTQVLADIGVSPYSLSIPAALGSSGTGSVTLTNVSSSTVALSTFSLTPSDFTQTNDCNGSLAAAATCTVNVTFTPSVLGTVNGSLTINFSGQGSPQIIPLTGKGGTPLEFTPMSLDFGQQALNLASTPQNVSLSNQSTAPVTINSINVSGDFQLASNQCPNPIQPFYNCYLQITFTPTASGAATGTLTVSASDSSTLHTVSLSGTGAVIPQVSLTPLSLLFNTQQAGTTSPPQTVALANTGDATLNISGIGASGDFAQTNNCGSSVASGSGCTINVTFTPTGGGTRNGTLSITDNAPGSPQTVSLSGAAVSPVALVSPSAMSFPSRALNTTSSPQKEALANATAANANLTVSGIAITGDFAQTNNCVGTLMPNADCSINVTFTPTAGGTRTGTLTITDNAPDSPQIVPLSGTGASDFVLGVNAGAPSSDTVTAGNSASYSIAVAPVGGFNQTIVLGCAGAPAGATCTAAPSSMTMDGTSLQKATVTVTTHAASLAPPGPRDGPPPPGGFPAYEWWVALLWLMMMAMLALAINQRRRRVPLLAGAVLLAALAVSCGGGSSGGGGGGSIPGTPKGTYTLTVTGTSGSLQHQTTMQLTVQ